MGLLELLVVLALIGCVGYMLVTYVPMLAPFKTLIMILAVLFCVLILLRAIGLDMPVPRLR